MRRSRKNRSLTATFIGKGILYSLIVFHLLVVLSLIFDKLRLSDYVYALILFFIFGIIPFTAIYVILEMLFFKLKKRWEISGSVIFKVILSAFITGIMISLILLISACFYPEPVFEVWKSMLVKDGFWIFIAYAPIVFFVDYIAGLINPRLKH